MLVNLIYNLCVLMPPTNSFIRLGIHDAQHNISQTLDLGDFLLKPPAYEYQSNDLESRIGDLEYASVFRYEIYLIVSINHEDEKVFSFLPNSKSITVTMLAILGNTGFDATLRVSIHLHVVSLHHFHSE